MAVSDFEELGWRIFEANFFLMQVLLVIRN